MIIVLVCIIAILSLAVFLFGVALYLILRDTTYMSRKEKDFIVFTIDMYVDYAKDLNIHSETEHDNLVKELNKIKEKHFKE